MVVVNFKTNTSKHYKIDVPADAKISQVKEEVSKEIEGSDPSSVKLIYKARVLGNNVPLSSLKLKEKDTILVQVPKAKPAEPKPEPEPLPLNEAEPEKEVEKPPEQNFEDSVKALSDLGFDPQVSAAALRAANGNMDLAAELIITGQIGGGLEGAAENSEAEAEPQNPPQQPQNPPQQPQPAAAEQEEPPASVTAAADLPPELANVPQDQAAETLLAAFPQEEQDAIHRLQSLGNFNLLEVIQVYHACDKNEELAANILFSYLE